MASSKAHVLGCNPSLLIIPKVSVELKAMVIFFFLQVKGEALSAMYLVH